MNCAICRGQFDSGLIEIMHGEQKSFWCSEQWNQWLDDQLDPDITEQSYVRPAACPSQATIKSA